MRHFYTFAILFLLFTSCDRPLNNEREKENKQDEKTYSILEEQAIAIQTEQAYLKSFQLKIPLSEIERDSFVRLVTKWGISIDEQFTVNSSNYVIVLNGRAHQSDEAMLNFLALSEEVLKKVFGKARRYGKDVHLVNIIKTYELLPKKDTAHMYLSINKLIY